MFNAEVITPPYFKIVKKYISGLKGSLKEVKSDNHS
jgi:hypothetical protein